MRVSFLIKVHNSDRRLRPRVIFASFLCHLFYLCDLLLKEVFNDCESICESFKKEPHETRCFTRFLSLTILFTSISRSQLLRHSRGLFDRLHNWNPPMPDKHKLELIHTLLLLYLTVGTRQRTSYRQFWWQE